MLLHENIKPRKHESMQEKPGLVEGIFSYITQKWLKSS